MADAASINATCFDGYNRNIKRGPIVRDAKDYAEHVVRNFKDTLKPNAIDILASYFAINSANVFIMRDRFSLILGILEFLKWEMEKCLELTFRSRTGIVTEVVDQKRIKRRIKRSILNKLEFVLHVRRRGMREQVERKVADCCNELFDEEWIRNNAQRFNINDQTQRQQFLKLIFENIIKNKKDAIIQIADIFIEVGEEIEPLNFTKYYTKQKTPPEVGEEIVPLYGTDLHDNPTTPPPETFKSGCGLAYHFLKHGHRQDMTMWAYAVLAHYMVWDAKELIKNEGGGKASGTITKDKNYFFPLLTMLTKTEKKYFKVDWKQNGEINIISREKWFLSYKDELIPEDSCVKTLFVPGFDKVNPQAAAKTWRGNDPQDSHKYIYSCSFEGINDVDGNWTEMYTNTFEWARKENEKIEAGNPSKIAISMRASMNRFLLGTSNLRLRKNKGSLILISILLFFFIATEFLNFDFPFL